MAKFKTKIEVARIIPKDKGLARRINMGWGVYDDNKLIKQYGLKKDAQEKLKRYKFAKEMGYI